MSDEAGHDPAPVRRRWNRRRFFRAGLVAATGIVGLAGIGGVALVNRLETVIPRADLLPGTTPAAGTGPLVAVRAHTRWGARPDGVMPARGDEGIAFRVTALAGPAPTVRGGTLVGNLPSRSSATYVMQVLDAKVQRIGAEFAFGPGSDGGAAGLIAWAPERPLTSHCHIAISPTRWYMATVEEGDFTLFAQGLLPRPLAQDGSPHRAECVVTGDTVALTLPDGSVAVAAHESVSRLPGTGACWEFYRRSDDGADVRFLETWAT